MVNLYLLMYTNNRNSSIQNKYLIANLFYHFQRGGEDSTQKPFFQGSSFLNFKHLSFFLNFVYMNLSWQIGSGWQGTRDHLHVCHVSSSLSRSVFPTSYIMIDDVIFLQEMIQHIIKDLDSPAHYCVDHFPQSVKKSVTRVWGCTGLMVLPIISEWEHYTRMLSCTKAKYPQILFPILLKGSFFCTISSLFLLPQPHLRLV